MRGKKKKAGKKGFAHLRLKKLSSKKKRKIRGERRLYVCADKEKKDEGNLNRKSWHDWKMGRKDKRGKEEKYWQY